MLRKRIFAYILDLYIVTLSQLLIFSLYRSLDEKEFGLSFMYIITNHKYTFLFIYYIYYLVSEFLFLKTIGKKIFKLEVKFTNRNLMSIIIRTVSRLIPIDLFFIVFNRNKTLHDILSNTQVIDKKS